MTEQVARIKRTLNSLSLSSLPKPNGKMLYPSVAHTRSCTSWEGWVLEEHYNSRP